MARLTKQQKKRLAGMKRATVAREQKAAASQTVGKVTRRTSGSLPKAGGVIRSTTLPTAPAAPTVKAKVRRAGPMGAPVVTDFRAWQEKARQERNTVKPLGEGSAWKLRQRKTTRTEVNKRVAKTTRNVQSPREWARNVDREYARGGFVRRGVRREVFVEALVVYREAGTKKEKAAALRVVKAALKPRSPAAEKMASVAVGRRGALARTEVDQNRESSFRRKMTKSGRETAKLAREIDKAKAGAKGSTLASLRRQINADYATARDMTNSKAVRKAAALRMAAAQREYNKRQKARGKDDLYDVMKNAKRVGAADR